MKIKVGQWVRTSQNTIVQLVGLNKYKNELRYFDYIGKYSGKILCENNIIKVADTPQELIKEKDLLMYQDNLLYVYAIIDKLYFQDKRGYAYKFDLCSKILTPNSNGGYDLQWEEE